MMQENNTRYSVWQKLENPFDYSAFCSLCSESDITPMDAIDFAFKVGRIMVARNLYPDLDDIQAYTKLSADHQLQNIMPCAHKANVAAPTIEIPIPDIITVPPGCGGCGGGAVR